jgi:hypothetical protein
MMGWAMPYLNCSKVFLIVCSKFMIIALVIMVTGYRGVKTRTAAAPWRPCSWVSQVCRHIYNISTTLI